MTLRLFSITAVMMAFIAQSLGQERRSTMQHMPAHEWVVVNEFGNSRCLVDRNSIEKRGEIVRVLVMYALDPPGTDKRNNQKVASMLNVEEYDLQARAFRVQQIVFRYADGTESMPLRTGSEWRPATAGNERTLIFLQGLDKD